MMIYSHNMVRSVSDKKFDIAIKSDINKGIYELFAIREQEGKKPLHIRLGKYDSLATLTYIINRLREEHSWGTKAAQITDNDVIKLK